MRYFRELEMIVVLKTLINLSMQAPTLLYYNLENLPRLVSNPHGIKGNKFMGS